MSYGSNFFAQRDETPLYPFRLVIIPNLNVNPTPLMYLPMPSFEQAVEQKIILGHTLLYLAEQKMMHPYPNAFFIERFDIDTQQWITIDDDDEPSEHGLSSDAGSVSDYMGQLTENFFTQRGMSTGE